MSNQSSKPPASNHKRKAHPNSTPSNSHSNPANKRQKFSYQPDSRVISSQTTGKAFGNGAIDVDKFVRAREYEIKALEDGMRRAKKHLSKRAFQSVPRDMRRRTASHNVKRVPKRLQARAAKEMADDNTPKIDKMAKMNTKRRLRLDTVKKLRNLSFKREAKKTRSDLESTKTGKEKPSEKKTSKIRVPRVKSNKLSTLPVPKARFRKRQIHKAWLPTHIFHAKRAHMTPPSAPLWRMAIPLSPTQKGYRPTHRASTARGAIAWDMSYMSTISLEGLETSTTSLLKLVGVGEEDESGCWGRGSDKWISGTRFWEGYLYEPGMQPLQCMAPVIIIWAARESSAEATPSDKAPRQVFVRVHPSAFINVWEKLLAGAKVQKPPVTMQDLRFEIGSIELMGPASLEILHGVLRPVSQALPQTDDSQPTADPGRLLQILSSVINPSALPQNVLLPLSLSDPRLSNRTKVKSPQGIAANEAHDTLLKVLTTWPLDTEPIRSGIFSRTNRLAASRQMPSQKAINRRRTLAPTGSEPEARESDPTIPAILYVSRPASGSGQGSYTLLLPWKYVVPFWYCLMHQPLSSGGTIRFGGLNERRQVTFESGLPWFPGDFPGTAAGMAWEEREREKRHDEWKARPPGKRVAWDSLNLGTEEKGEVGVGWSCDWRFLLGDLAKQGGDADGDVEMTTSAEEASPKHQPQQLSRPAAQAMLSGPPVQPSTDQASALAMVKVTPITAGVPTTCARIYRLPSCPELRQQWLALRSSRHGMNGQKHGQTLPTRPAKEAPLHVRRQHLAASILSTPLEAESKTKHPHVPGKEDLIGFVTTGNFNLSQGKGFGIGSIVLAKALGTREGDKGEERLCIVRNAGQIVGRLARWELV